MVDPAQLALIHAEIDGELDDRQRAELSRGLLADPGLRAVREQMRTLCRALEAVPKVDAPVRLRADILAALPQTQLRRPRVAWAAAQWRYAAVLAGVLLTGAIVFRIMDFGQNAPVNEMSGTLAAPRAAGTVDMVQISEGGVSGQASLIREGADFGVTLTLAASAPVDVVIATGGHSVRVDGLGALGQRGAGPTTIALPGPGRGGQSVELTFLVADREVARAVLREPVGR